MSNQPTILIVEDDPVLRRVVAFAIQSAGFRCVTASNGQEAVARLNEVRVDLLVTDHQMPVCSGLELIEHVRRTPELAGLPIVLCTAKGFELDADAIASAYQLVAVLRKPFSPRMLTELISRHVDAPSATAGAGYSPVVSQSAAV